MNKTKTLCALVCVCLALVLLLSGCANHGKTLITAGKEKISVNVFMLYLSRAKGNLALAGEDVTNPEYWKGYVDFPKVTVADYRTAEVLEGLKHIAAAMILYHEVYKLELPDEVVESIDAWIDDLVEKDGGGSKAALNEILAAYGANITVLRDACILEAKMDHLKEALYGVNGALLQDTLLEKYYQDTYLRGYQMWLANYYFEHDKDKDGVAVRYTDEKYDRIAYLPQSEIDKLPEAEQAKYVTVANEGKYREKYGALYGETILLYREGETEVVAYDKENGVIRYHRDKNGDEIKVLYTELEMEARYEQAKRIAAECAGDFNKFYTYVTELSDDSDFHNKIAPNGMYFSLGTYHTEKFLSACANQLATMEVGDTHVLAYGSSYHILMRTELDKGAWKQEANTRWFKSLRGLAMEYMLQLETTEYFDRLVIDEEVLAGVDITSVASNVRY